MYLFAPNERSEVRCIIGGNYTLILDSASHKGPSYLANNVRRLIDLSLSDCYEIGNDAIHVLYGNFRN